MLWVQSREKRPECEYALVRNPVLRERLWHHWMAFDPERGAGVRGAGREWRVTMGAQVLDLLPRVCSRMYFRDPA